MTYHFHDTERNGGRPSRWWVTPGIWVCGVPDEQGADGICGESLNDRPCNRHGECDHGSDKYTVTNDAHGWPLIHHSCGHIEGYSSWWGTGEVMEVTYPAAQSVDEQSPIRTATE